jgi:putative ABC transport system permease protein
MLGFLINMALKNALRHRLRACLTLAGLTIAILAFGLLNTVVTAWYAGADAASDKRLVTRSAISLAFALPISYADQIRAVDGVTSISWANWFGGVYIDERNFFPQFGIHAETYLPLYPEFVLDEAQKTAFLRDRQGCIAGRKLAARYGWKVGDTIPIRGTIYSGTYNFVLRGIYNGREAGTNEEQFFFHWELLNERIKQLYPKRGDATGVFIVGIKDAGDAALISQRIDSLYHNSVAETLTETEKSFQLGFVAMLSTVVLAIQVVSYVVIVIIMAVMANTMAMAARERTSEYATLKALGFAPSVVGWLILLESVLLCTVGGALGIAATFPVVWLFRHVLDGIFPIFNIASGTLWQQAAGAVVISLVAAAVPMWQSTRIRIVDGLRAVG